MATWKEAIEAYRTHCTNVDPSMKIDPMAMYGDKTAIFDKGNGYRVYVGSQPNNVNTAEEVEALLTLLGVPIDQGWN